MLQPDQRHRQHRRNSGDADGPQDKLPSYQDLLDEALDDTFPASDPPATTAATRVHEPHATARDSHDWTLQPERGGTGPAPQARAAPVAATLAAPLQLGGLTVPAGPCELAQSEHAAVLSWHEHGQPRRTEIDLEALRALLADGRLQRHASR